METLTKVSVETAVLQDLVSRAVKASTNIAVIPLTCLMEIEIENNVLYVRTTDNTNYVTVKKQLTNPTGNFHVVVESKKFSDLVSRLDSKYTDLVIEGNKVTVLSGKGKYNIALESEEGNPINFPRPEFVATSEKIMVNANEVRTILSLNKSCKAETRDIPALYTYYFDNEKSLTSNNLKICYNGVKLSDKPIVLLPSIVELIPSVMNEVGVEVSQNETDIKFESEIGTLIGKKGSKADLDAYPAEELVEVFNLPVQSVVNINRTIFLNAVDRMGLFVDSNEQHKIKLTFTAEGLKLYSPSTDSSDIVDYITKLSDFDEVELETNALDIKNVLTSCDTESLTVSFDAEIGVIITCGDIRLAIAIIDE